MTTHRLLASAVFIGLLAFVNVSFAQMNTMHPETVMVTLHVKPGSEAEMQRVLEEHWKTVTAMNLVSNTPHLTIRGTEAGDKTYFVDVFTWRDASIPDDAPPEIQKLWDEMNRLVESRGGQPGLDFVPVSVISH